MMGKNPLSAANRQARVRASRDTWLRRASFKLLATAGLLTAATVYTSPAAAQSNIEDAEVEVYGTLLPFLESVGTYGATPVGTMATATQVSSGAYSGINHEQRFRMTSGTSNIGFRGKWFIDEYLHMLWQVESPAPIDGEGPSNWANRNSHVGLGGPWGSFVYGSWDTPMRWATVTSINPIKGGYTGDMTAIIGSPGHQTPAWNADQTFNALLEIPPNRAGFFRHEANSIQYWSPDVAGFSTRLMFASNEHRTATIPGLEQGINPYLFSGSVGYDLEWLRIRYAYEFHKDYFGMGNLAGSGPSPQTPSSADDAHLALVSVKLNAGTDYQTRIVAAGDRLSYHTDDATPNGGGFTNEFSREAFYGLVHQTLGGHNIWGAYGFATEGKCNVTGGFPCNTVGLGAQYFTLGYMYEFGERSGIYALGYNVINDVSARYTPFPLLEWERASDPSLPNRGAISPGSDVLGIGVGFVYTFSVKILGDEDPKPAQEPKPAPPPKRAPKKPAAPK